MTILTTLLNPTKCTAKQYLPQPGDPSTFAAIRFSDGDGSNISVFWKGDRSAPALAIADIFNGNLEGLADRIEEVLSDASDMDVTFADFALAIACDLTGNDIDEAYRARREAKEAAA